MIQWRIDRGFLQFRCERHRCWLRPEACLGRQKKAVGGYNFISDVGVDYSKCNGCLDGQNIEREWRGKVMDQATKCKVCGERDAVLKKTDGKPMNHGMCRECFGEKIRKTWQEKPALKSTERLISDKGKAQEAEAAARDIVGEVRREEPLSLDIDVATACQTTDAPLKLGRRPCVLLDLSPHPEIEEWLIRSAAHQLRTVENQILWELQGICDFERKCDGSFFKESGSCQE